MNGNVVLIVDQDQRYTEAVQRGRKINSHYEAPELNRLIKPLGRSYQSIAIISETDTVGAEDYRMAGYEIVTMDGNRPSELRQFIRRLQQNLSANPPERMVVVTTDEEFEFLFDQVLQNQRTKLSVWAPGSSVPSSLTHPAYDYRPLEDLLPEIKVSKVDIRLDYENLYFGLEQRGLRLEPKNLTETVKVAVADLGEVVNIVAYADWDVLANSANRNLQRELASIGVETRYQLSLRGKNSADMKMADDIRTLMERNTNDPDAVDVIVLGTCDRDFRPTVETAKARGKKLIILGLEGGLSAELRRVTGKDIRYLDRFLNLPTARQLPENAPKPSDRHAKLIVHTVVWLNSQGWKWGHLLNLAEALQINSQSPQLRQAIEDEVLIHPDGTIPSDALALNSQLPLVRAIQRLVQWAPGRVGYCLNVKCMPYVDSNFLANGMKMDKRLNQLDAGQNNREAEGWLDLLAEAGILVKQMQPHPKVDNKTIHTWWLPVTGAPKPEESGHCAKRRRSLCPV